MFTNLFTKACLLLVFINFPSANALEIGSELIGMNFSNDQLKDCYPYSTKALSHKHVKDSGTQSFICNLKKKQTLIYLSNKDIIEVALIWDRFSQSDFRFMGPKICSANAKKSPIFLMGRYDDEGRLETKGNKFIFTGGKISNFNGEVDCKINCLDNKTNAFCSKTLPCKDQLEIMATPHCIETHFCKGPESFDEELISVGIFLKGEFYSAIAINKISKKVVKAPFNFTNKKMKSYVPTLDKTISLEKVVSLDNEVGCMTRYKILDKDVINESFAVHLPGLKTKLNLALITPTEEDYKVFMANQKVCGENYSIISDLSTPIPCLKKHLQLVTDLNNDKIEEFWFNNSIYELRENEWVEL